MSISRAGFLTRPYKNEDSFLPAQERPKPISVCVFSERVWVTFDDQRVIGLPLTAFPWLEQATSEQQRNVEANSISVYWPDLEDGIDMEYFTGEWLLSD